MTEGIKTGLSIVVLGVFSKSNLLASNKIALSFGVISLYHKGLWGRICHNKESAYQKGVCCEKNWNEISFFWRWGSECGDGSRPLGTIAKT
jgi:hypothetical protein